MGSTQESAFNSHYSPPPHYADAGDPLALTQEGLLGCQELFSLNW